MHTYGTAWGKVATDFLKIEAKCDKRVLLQHQEEVSRVRRVFDLVYQKAASGSLVAFGRCVEEMCKMLAKEI